MAQLQRMDKQQYVNRMQEECRRILEQIADAINEAPTGQVISGSEMQVRDLMAQLRQKAFEAGIQMRIDAEEAIFPPRQPARPLPGEQGTQPPEHADGQRADQLVAKAVVRRGQRKRLPGGQAAG